MIIKKISWSNAQFVTDNLTFYKIPFKLSVDAFGRCVLEIEEATPAQIEKLPVYIKNFWRVKK